MLKWDRAGHVGRTNPKRWKHNITSKWMPKTVNGNAADRERGGGTNWTHSGVTLEEGRIEDRGAAFAEQWDIDNDLKKTRR